MTNTLDAYLEQEILSADPLRLVCMLYQAAIMEIRDARRHLAAGNVPARCAAITKACDLVGELLSSLDRDGGGQVAEQLSSLYAYSLNRLLEANMKKSDAPLAEVLALLTTLSEGWQEIASNQRSEAAVLRSTPAAYVMAGAQGYESASHSWSF